MKKIIKTERMEIRLTKEEKEQIQKMVEDSTFSNSSELLRNIIKSYLDLCEEI